MYERKGLDAVKVLIGKRAAYEALAEESSELTQASLKVIRSLGLAGNPTPVTFEEAQDNLREEMRDVLACLYVLGVKIPDVKELVLCEKSMRWQKRLEKFLHLPDHEVDDEADI